MLAYIRCSLSFLFLCVCHLELNSQNLAYTDQSNDFSANQLFSSAIISTDYIQVASSGKTRGIRVDSDDAYIDFRSGGDQNKRLYIRAYETGEVAYYFTTFTKHRFNKPIEVTNSELLKMRISSWSNAEHTIIRRGWESSVGDALLLMSAGNQSTGNGALLIGDGNGGKVWFGRQATNTNFSDSSTDPLDETYAFIGADESYLQSNLQVDGTIETTKVKVTATPGSFPDYVFSKNYKLNTLKEVEEFIQENGHLPNMPTAKEVEANGQDLGLIQQKLLEKIEELTLHTIDQNKRIESLIKINALTQKRLEELENQKRNEKSN